MNVINNNFVQGIILLIAGGACAFFGAHYHIQDIQMAGSAVIGAALLHIKPTV